MNTFGHSMLLNLRAAAIGHGGAQRVLVLAVKRPLVGALEIGGMTNADGSPADWSLVAGSSGAFTPPRGADTAHSLRYEYASEADAGKAVMAWVPI